MSIPSRVLVVGASVGGLAVVEALRREKFAGEITLLGAEKHAPYDRPPLSKKVLAGAIPPEKVQLRSEAELAKLDVQLHLGAAAVRLDATSHSITTASGTTYSADAIVLATGLEPKRLPGQPNWKGVHVLRTLEDALALRADLLTNPRVVVVGEGVLGTEVAATARELGLSVTIVGPQPLPLASQFGAKMGELLAALHTRKGVQLRLGVGVAALEGEQERVTGVRLSSGEVLPADVVFVAIGARPSVGWLADSGLTLSDGIVCDARCRAAEGIYAVGDVARWQNVRTGTSMRMENRTNAVEQAAVVAANLVGKDTVYAPIPFFWTEQFDAKIQALGYVSADAEVRIVEGSPEENAFVALYGRNGKVTAALGWNMMKQVRTYRPMVVDGAALP